MARLTWVWFCSGDVVAVLVGGDACFLIVLG